MDLQSLSMSELYALRDQVEAEVVRKQSAEKTEALKKVQALMSQYGLSADDLAKKATTARKPVEAKYQNPADPSQTWTGRGRKPLWVQAYLDNGGALEQLAVA
ncbi:H-NS histone family protein [Vogesella sp. GCM10023246]|uniref:H-NS histone family protein n=1 Tax=Vogesella oryzagri TaxID=3160864 RepID=A0ABV1M7Q9_9NEIS